MCVSIAENLSVCRLEGKYDAHNIGRVAIFSSKLAAACPPGFSHASLAFFPTPYLGANQVLLFLSAALPGLSLQPEKRKKKKNPSSSSQRALSLPSSPPSSMPCFWQQKKNELKKSDRPVDRVVMPTSMRHYDWVNERTSKSGQWQIKSNQGDNATANTRQQALRLSQWRCRNWCKNKASATSYCVAASSSSSYR